MSGLVLIFLGAGTGGVLRHVAGAAMLRVAGPDWPWGTLLVNVTGSALLGVLTGLLALRPASAEPWRLLLATGVLGGFTTFSAFSLDAVQLLGRSPGAGAAYILLSVLLSLGALALGLAAVRG